MQTELTFILFMLLICSIAVLYLYLIARSEKKRCQNCESFTLRKESKRVVYLLIPTSNHNCGSSYPYFSQLYIF